MGRQKHRCKGNGPGGSGGRAWEGRHVCFHSDNLAVVMVLTKRSAKDRHLLALLRCLFFLASFHKFQYSAVHVPGVYNTAADALSRSSITDFSPFVPQIPACRVPDNHGTAGSPDAGLDLPGVDRSVQTLIGRGLSTRSHASYRTGITRYLRFCQRFSLPSLPLSQLNLCRFVAFLHAQNLSPSTIRVYLSGVRYHQIQSGGLDPSRIDMPQLH